MSYLKSIAEALASERYRYIPGTDKGIAKAILNRSLLGREPQDDDWEWLSKIVVRVLQAENRLRVEADEQDRHDAQWAQKLADTRTSKQLRVRLLALNGLHTGPEVRDSATRSTRKSVANEAARDGYHEVRIIEMALELQDNQ